MTTIYIDSDTTSAVATIQDNFGFVTNQVFHLSEDSTSELPVHLQNLAWGIVDRCRAYTTYAPIVLSDNGQAVPDFQYSRSFWDDEVTPV
jgi:hypothetical protein